MHGVYIASSMNGGILLKVVLFDILCKNTILHHLILTTPMYILCTLVMSYVYSASGTTLQYISSRGIRCSWTSGLPNSIRNLPPRMAFGSETLTSQKSIGSCPFYVVDKDKRHRTFISKSSTNPEGSLKKMGRWDFLVGKQDHVEMEALYKRRNTAPGSWNGQTASVTKPFLV